MRQIPYPDTGHAVSVISLSVFHILPGCWGHPPETKINIKGTIFLKKIDISLSKKGLIN